MIPYAYKNVTEAGFELGYVTSPLLEEYGVRHLFSTALFKKTDEKEDIFKRYLVAAQILRAPFERMTCAAQVHGDTVITVDESDLGIETVKEADGLVTALKDAPLFVYTADCVPILIASKDGGVVSAVHSGWRGTAKGIVARAVSIMKTKFALKGEDILCAIGPCISKCCFEVGGEVITALEGVVDDISIYFHENDSNGLMLNLKDVNREILENAGIPPKNIDVLPHCTMCEQGLFYSYRRDGDSAGRQASFICAGGSL